MCSQGGCALQVWPSAQPSLHSSSQNRVGKCTNSSENKAVCIKCLVFFFLYLRICNSGGFVSKFENNTLNSGFIAEKFVVVLCWRSCSGRNCSLVLRYAGHSHRYQLRFWVRGWLILQMDEFAAFSFWLKFREKICVSQNRLSVKTFLILSL